MKQPRIGVNLNERGSDYLRETAELAGTDPETAMAQAIVALAFLNDELAEGASVQLVKTNLFTQPTLTDVTFNGPVLSTAAVEGRRKIFRLVRGDLDNA